MSRLLPDALSIKSTTEKKTEISGQNRAFCPWDSKHPLDSLHGRLAPAFFPITTPAPQGLAYPPHHPPGSKAAASSCVYSILSPKSSCYLSCPSLSLLQKASQGPHPTHEGSFSEQLKDKRSASWSSPRQEEIPKTKTSCPFIIKAILFNSVCAYSIPPQNLPWSPPHLPHFSWNWALFPLPHTLVISCVLWPELALESSLFLSTQGKWHLFMESVHTVNAHANFYEMHPLWGVRGGGVRNYGHQ